MKKVVGLGACVLDTLINCSEYPKEDTKLKADGVFLAGGGPVGNALVIMSKLGLNTQVLGGFARDNAGDYLLNDFEKYGVDTSKAVRVDGATSFTSFIVLSEKNKTRTCVFDRGTVKDEIENVNFSAIDNAFLIHLDGNYLQCAIASAKYAKERGVKVSLDAGGLYNGIEKLLPFVDVLIPSKEFALGFTKESDVEKAMVKLYEQFSPEVLVVTDGSNGGYYLENGKVKHYDGVKVEVLDTNGAGDTFHGAFIVAYCNKKGLKECCDFASKVAGYKCMHKGARTFELNEQIINEYFN